MAVLDRPARNDVISLHADLVAPCQLRIADQVDWYGHHPAIRDRGVRHPRSDSTPAAASLLHCQAFLPVEPLGLLPANHDPLMAYQDMQTPMAEPTMLVVQLAELLTQPGIIVPRGTVTRFLRPATMTRRALPAAHSVASLEMNHGFPLSVGRQACFLRSSFKAA